MPEGRRKNKAMTFMHPSTLFDNLTGVLTWLT